MAIFMAHSMVLGFGNLDSSVLATTAPAVGGGGGNAVELIGIVYLFIYL